MRNQNQRKLKVEKLQSRELMAADIVGGELRIEGTRANNEIEISLENRPSFVFRDGRIQRVTREMVRVDIDNQAPDYFDAALVDHIFAQGLGGSDTITNNTDIPSTLHGNDGNDILKGGSADDTLVGGDDNDTLLGGSGNDNLYGRAGTDLLAGGADNDGLFGGRGYDRLYGGSGVNRLLSTRDGDFIYSPDSNDAVIEFRSGSYQFNRFGYFTGGSWTDEQIETVDLALERIHDATGSTNLLKTHTDGRLQFVHRGFQVYGNTQVSAWNYGNVINVHHGAFELAGSDDPRNELAAVQTILHEIGHNWDAANENSTVDEFYRFSGWSADGETRSSRGTAGFARAYGSTKAIEDFATAFAAYFMPGEYIDFDNEWATADFTGDRIMQSKLNYMRFLDGRV